MMVATTQCWNILPRVHSPSDRVEYGKGKMRIRTRVRVMIRDV